MKKGVHPENYRLVAFKDMSNDDVFLTKSTANTSETIEVEGVEYPLIKMEIFSFLKFYFRTINWLKVILFEILTKLLIIIRGYPFRLFI
mgnify:CR=1 FL=1